MFNHLRRVNVPHSREKWKYVGKNHSAEDIALRRFAMK
jgi:hypothetical protein